MWFAVWLWTLGWHAMPVHLATQRPAIASKDFFCESNADCSLPEVCCTGPWFNYCCDIGAMHRRLRPNRTVADPFPWPRQPVPG